MQTVKGKRSVQAAVASDVTVDRIIIAYKQQFNQDIKSIIRSAKEKGIKIQIIPNMAFSKMIEEQNTQGVVAYIRTQKEKTLESIIVDKAANPILIAVDHIQDPYNFGAILRTCESFGIKSILYPKDRNVQITPGVIKASSGAIHLLNLIRVTNLAEALRACQKQGYWVYGADSNSGAPFDEKEINFPAIIVVGNEEKGISKKINQMLDFRVNIPSLGQTESLNVSVATGILGYHFSKALKNSVLDTD